MIAEPDSPVVAHPQGKCPDAKSYRITGDVTRRVVRLCDACATRYSRAPFYFRFAPADEERRGVEPRELSQAEASA